MSKTVKIFLASSNELEEDRLAFRLFISEKYSKTNRGVKFEIVVWENESEAMDLERSQNVYNRRIGECEFFVMLYHTKVGQFTNEEFGTAYNLFKARKNPKKIIVYKKTAAHGPVPHEDDLSRIMFEEALDSQYFKGEYESKEGLLLKFSQELDLYQNNHQPETFAPPLAVSPVAKPAATESELPRDELHCFDCNRRLEYLALIDFFESNKNEFNHLHIFLEAEDVHRPESLVARFAYDEGNEFYQNVEPILGTEPITYGNGLVNNHAIKRTIINYIRQTPKQIKKTLKNCFSTSLDHRKNEKEWSMLFFEINMQDCFVNDEKELIRFFKENKWWEKYENKKLIFFYWMKNSQAIKPKSVFEKFFSRNKSSDEPYTELRTYLKSSENILYLNDFSMVETLDLKNWFSALNFDNTYYDKKINQILPGAEPRALAEVEPLLMENINPGYYGHRR